MRPLHQRRRQRRILAHRPVLAAVLEVLVSEHAPNDVEGFCEHLARLLLIDTERCELRRTQAAAEPHVEATIGQVVQHRRLFGDQQRMPEWQDIDHAGKADPARRPRGGSDQQIGRRHRPRRVQMMFEEPDLIDADAFRQLDLFKLAAKHFLMCRIFPRGGRRPYGEFHCFLLPGLCRRQRRVRSFPLPLAAHAAKPTPHFRRPALPLSLCQQDGLLPSANQGGWKCRSKPGRSTTRWLSK